MLLLVSCRRFIGSLCSSTFFSFILLKCFVSSLLKYGKFILAILFWLFSRFSCSSVFSLVLSSRCLRFYLFFSF